MSDLPDGAAAPVDLPPTVVVGTGLLGTSVGLALRRAGVVVHLVDRDPVHAQAAESLGAGSSAAPPDPADVGLVVVAVPPVSLGDVLADALTTWPAAVVTDVGSVKVAPWQALRDHGADLTRYVGSHPMAGSERSGPWAATAGLFDGRAWAVVPHDAASPDAVRTVHRLAVGCGASVVELTPDEHDAAVARVSHLPHLMSVLTAGALVDAPPLHLALAGQGLRDVTRVAAGDPGLWTQIVAANAVQIGALLVQVRDQLDVLLAALGGSPQTLRAGLDPALRRGATGTRRVPGKHGEPAPSYTVVYVAIPDRPGALARLFTDAGESGVNIEDLRIDHDPARPVGVVEVVVASDSAATLVRQLSDRGWSVDG